MRQIIVITVLAVLFFAANPTHGELAKKDSNLITIAFQNGFLAALRLDIEEIKKLKDDNATMQKKVEDASQKYLKRVQDMNK